VLDDVHRALAVRVATAADVPAIVDLVESAYRGDASRVGWTTEADLLDGQRTDADVVAEAVADTAGRILLATDESGHLVACCQVEPHGDGVCYFGMFAVRPTAQGSGIGRSMLAAAEAFGRDELGAGTMEMTVIAQRDEPIAWYERRGYARTDEVRPFPYGDERFGKPRRDDLHFVVLAKDLTR
jgi:ribosomal protein S18 acetylase RimI-like enzyme